MSNDLISIILLSALGGVLGITGGVLVLLNKKLSSALSTVAIPYAAGVLITVSLTHLFPHALEEGGEHIPLVLLISFFIAFLFENFFLFLHHHDDGHDHTKGSVSLVIVGDTIHNAIDGVAIAAGFLISPSIGLLIAIATFIHEIPHEIGDFGILLARKWKKINIIIANFVSALSTVFAAVLAYFWLDSFPTLVPYLLAISGGIFLYLGASDFLPEIVSSKKKSLTPIFAIVAGIATILLLGVFFPEIEM